MGSSTASETTINTSTDSSNTIVTTVTATDGDVTEDSLELTEPIDYFSSENILDSKMSNPILQPIPLSPKTPATARQQTPPTAKNDTKFTFEVETKPWHRDESTPKVIVKEDIKFTFEQTVTNNVHGDKPSEKPADKSAEMTVDKLMEEQIEALKMEARRRNSYKQAAQNFDEIQVANDSVNQNMHSPKEHRRSFRRKLDVEKEKVERTSPKRRAERVLNSSPENETDSPKPKHRQLYFK